MNDSTTNVHPIRPGINTGDEQTTPPGFLILCRKYRRIQAELAMISMHRTAKT